ncbi:MAG TPA: V-type ATPase subunit [Clostridiales bacterium]|nr:V-type ATPase subunit [Clostridiales bacterium]
MNNVVRYAAVNTKIRALEGQFLSREDCLALLEKDSVQGIVQYLRQTHYRDAFEGMDAANLHRGQIEVCLKRYAVDKLVRLKHYFRGTHARFLKVLFMRYEIEDLKLLIRAIETDPGYIYTSNPFVYIGRYGDLDYDKLIASKSFVELVDNLRASPYYSSLVPFAESGKQSNHFLVEMALDLFYINMFISHLELLTEGERQKIQDIYGMKADLLNIQWIYRGKKFYNLSPEVLLNYSINFGKRLNKAFIKDLCYSASVNEIEDKLKDGVYGFLFDHEKTKDIFMERRIFRYLYYRLRDYKGKSSMDMVQTIVFFDLLEFEIRDIITIIENIRYHNEDLEQIKRCLIRGL